MCYKTLFICFLCFTSTSVIAEFIIPAEKNPNTDREKALSANTATNTPKLLDLNLNSNGISTNFHMEPFGVNSRLLTNTPEMSRINNAAFNANIPEISSSVASLQSKITEQSNTLISNMPSRLGNPTFNLPNLKLESVVTDNNTPVTHETNSASNVPTSNSLPSLVLNQKPKSTISGSYLNVPIIPNVNIPGVSTSINIAGAMPSVMFSQSRMTHNNTKQMPILNVKRPDIITITNENLSPPSQLNVAITRNNISVPSLISMESKTLENNSIVVPVQHLAELKPNASAFVANFLNNLNSNIPLQIQIASQRQHINNEAYKEHTTIITDKSDTLGRSDTTNLPMPKESIENYGVRSIEKIYDIYSLLTDVIKSIKNVCPFKLMKYNRRQPKS